MWGNIFTGSRTWTFLSVIILPTMPLRPPSVSGQGKMQLQSTGFTHITVSRDPGWVWHLGSDESRGRGCSLDRLWRWETAPFLQIYWRKVILGDRGRKIVSVIMNMGCQGSRHAGYSSFAVWGLRIWNNLLGAVPGLWQVHNSIRAIYY